MPKRTHLEAEFALSLRAFKFPSWEEEFRFHPDRKWRFDFAWPELKVAVEVEGGTFARGKTRHTTGQGFHDDCIKYNAAAIFGWLVLRGDTKLVKDGRLVRWTAEALRRRKHGSNDGEDQGDDRNARA